MFDEVVIVLDELVSRQAYQQVDHRYLNGPAIDQVFADETPGDSVLWYLSDQQQTVRDVAKFTTITAGAQATVRNHLEYDSFGNVTSADDPTTGTANDGDLPGQEGVGNEYSPQRSYTGREPDPATGLIYYRARWYDPSLGRFISNDPIGFAAGDANLSRYVGNSTPNFVDPSGLDYTSLPSEQEQASQIAAWMAWARKEGISNFRFETLPPYVDPQGRRYQRIRVSGTKGFSLDGQDHITFNGPASYHRAGVDPTSSTAVDSTICRNKDGDVIAVPRQTREALSNATASLIEGSEHGQKVSYAVIIFVVPGPDDLVITGALATSVGKRLTAAGYEVVSDGIRMIIKKGGSEVSGESAEAARKIVTDAITDEASETARCARQKGDRMTIR